jgi:hypothetical protein
MSEETTAPIAKAAKRAAKRTSKNATPEPKTPEAELPAGKPNPDSATKRPKRRRGKKGKSSGEFPAKEETPETRADATPPPSSGPPPEEKPPANSQLTRPPQQPRQPQSPRSPSHDPADLSNKAWKIYLAEVSEEGIALINDQDAREIARRCFRLAELFLDEHARH